MLRSLKALHGCVAQTCLKSNTAVISAVRHGSHYPIDDDVFGLTEEQQQVCLAITIKI